MRTIPTSMATAIALGEFDGDNRAMTRVTIAKIHLGLYTVGQQTYSSVLFPSVSSDAFELPNLKSCKWDRSVDSETGTLTLELFNTAPLLPGTGPALDGSFDQLGYFTYNRGLTSYSQTAWGHTPNHWRDYLVPDRLLRVYQGYGSDFTVFPENDTHMALMGCYLIDDVEYTADGTITVTARDVGRLLSDEIMFPPVVPFKQYPLKFSKKSTTPGSPTGAISATWVRPSYDTDSGIPYVGLNGAQYGHHGTDAFDSQYSTYWLSIGNAQPAQGYSFEYIQGKFTARTLAAARAQVWGGPYRVYCSVKVGGVWQGKAIVPYDPNNPVSAPNGANIPYVATAIVDLNGMAEFVFSKAYDNATAVRFTFTDLYNSGLGPYPYRAGVRTVEITSKVTKVTGPSTTTGNYSDYSEIVKLLLAYGGFYWPQNGVQYLTGYPHGTQHTEVFTFGADDPYLVKGRVWGDIQMANVAGIADLGVDVWDKKTLLDGINYVRDILGFLFYVDEQGAAIFRSPNLFKLGNWQTDVNGTSTTRVSTYKTIRDDTAILSLRSKLSSRNLREKVFVGNVSGKIAAISNGRIPYPVNFRRVGGWTDQNFASASEVQIMADLITLRQLFSYRQNSIRIPADPSIQCDDQVQIIERTTGEAYLHYVRSISSSWDLQTGVWTYDLTTSWLGTDPSAEWAFKTTGLSAETQAYLAALGAI